MDHQSKSQHLGVNKLGKNIRKSPLHQPSSAFHTHRPPPPPSFAAVAPPQPQVYNISKNDFRSIVQQLTGTPSRDPTPPLPPPPHSAAAAPFAPNPQPRPPQPKPPSMRLQKIRPPPLTPIQRPPHPPVAALANPYQNHHNPSQIPFPAQHPNSNPAFFPRANPPANPPAGPFAAGPSWAESPVSAYMRYLETSLLSSDSSRQPQPYPQPHMQMPPPPQPLHSPGLLPSPRPPAPSSPLLPSPSAFMNFLSPKSPGFQYPLLSPGFQYPPPLTPNFAFSPLPQSGLLGPGPAQLPPSPSFLFPPSPSGFLPIRSPRWRDMM